MALAGSALLLGQRSPIKIGDVSRRTPPSAPMYVLQSGGRLSGPINETAVIFIPTNRKPQPRGVCAGRMLMIAQGNIGNIGAASQLPSQPLASKIYNALESAQGALAALENACNRTFGSLPTVVTGAGEPVSETTTDRSMDQLADIIRRIGRVADRLNDNL